MHANTAILFALLTLALPFIGGLLAYALPRKWGDWSFVLLTGVAAILGVNLAYQYWQTDLPLPIHEQLQWFSVAGGVQLSMGVYLDHLSTLMLATVAVLVFLVALYSTVYLKDEQTLRRYWFQLGLFVMAMQGILIADNLVQLFMFWELVGLASYLLIGYWHRRPLTDTGSSQAFMLNRVGDAMLLTGIVSLLFMMTTTDLALLPELMQGTRVNANGWYATLVTAEGKQMVKTLPGTWLTLTGLLLFGGALAKSAQFPLQVWLPEAMVGPTSISALLHAATMVAAGVYLIARIFPLLTPEALTVIAVIGTITAIIGALAATAQFDLKRVLAFSTMSQLGFMVAGLGVWAYADSLMHLFTHAVFKAGLFLGAGIIIAQIAAYAKGKGKDINAKDIAMMGGLLKRMPLVSGLFLLCLAALAGVPLFAGFLSKEGILAGAFSWAAVAGADSFWPYLIPYGLLFASAVTAFYCTRLAWLVFFGQPRIQHVAHIDFPARFPQPNWRLVLPMVVLGLVAFAVWFGPNPFAPQDSWLAKAISTPQPAVPFDDETVSLFEQHAAVVEGREVAGGMALGGSLVALALGFGLAFWMYRKLPPEPFSGDNDGLRTLFREQFFFSKQYVLWRIGLQALAWTVRQFDRKVLDPLLMLPLRILGSLRFNGRHNSLATQLAHFDRYLLDGFANGLGKFTLSLGSGLRTIHAGKLQTLLVLTVFLLLAFILILALS